jgi:hypothetical protein
MDPILLINFIGYALTITYGIFMIIYLSNAQKCDKYMDHKDQSFRKAALVITWIGVIISGLILLGLLVMLLSGARVREYGY